MLIGREKCPVDSDGCGRGQGHGRHQARAKWLMQARTRMQSYYMTIPFSLLCCILQQSNWIFWWLILLVH